MWTPYRIGQVLHSVFAAAIHKSLYGRPLPENTPERNLLVIFEGIVDRA